MRNEAVLQKMLMYTKKLSDYCAGYDYGSFILDTKLVDACVFNLSQIGELCRIVDDEYTKMHPEIPWRTFGVLFLRPFLRRRKSYENSKRHLCRSKNI